MTTTQNISAADLTIGTRFIPEGKKRAVEIFAIYKQAASYTLCATSPQGTSAHSIPFDGIAQVVA